MLKLLISLLLAVCLGLPVSAATGLSYVYPDYFTLIGQKKVIKPPIRIKQPVIGITSHHLPTASPLLDDFYGRLKLARPGIKTFVVVSPDHFEKCRLKFVTTDSSIGTMYGELAPDKQLSKELLATGLRNEAACFVGEHGIGVEANYIKKFFPAAKIVPIMLSYSAQNQNFSGLIKVLARHKDQLFVVESTDFTHYVDVKTANINDRTSASWIKSLNGQAFTLKQIDSPAAIRLILGLAKQLKLKPEILDHKNSFDYNGEARNTTSYFSVMF